MPAHNRQMHSETPLRFAVIGTGGISWAHRTAFLHHPNEVVLTAACDINLQAAQNFVQPLGYEVPVYASHLELLQAEHKNIDAAILILPHFLHFPVAQDFIHAGIPLLVEKPLVCSLDEARTLRELAARANVPVVAGQMWRFVREAVWLRRWILADPRHFGAARSFTLQAWQNIYGYMGGPTNTHHWVLDGAKAGGGIVITVAIHPLDLLRFLTGCNYRTVMAQGRFDPPCINGAESSASVVLEMEGGATGVLHADYRVARTPYSEAMTLFGDTGTILQHPSEGEYDGRFRFATTLDHVTYEWSQMYQGFDWVDPAVALPDAELPGVPLMAGLTDDRFANQLRHFARAIRQGERPINHIDENFNTLATVFAIYAALHSGRVEPVAHD